MANYFTLAVLTCLVLGSCTVDPPPVANSQYERIRSVQWMPGDSLIAAVVYLPSEEYDQNPVFRLYDLHGNSRLEISLIDDLYLFDLYVTKTGEQALYEANGSVYLLDIQKKTSELVLPEATLISHAPDADVFVVRKSGLPFSESPYMLAEIVDEKVIVDSVHALPNDIFQSFFPLLLSKGRVATLELDDSSSSMLFIIRDYAQNIQKRFFMPFSVQIMYPVVTTNSVDFFFIQWAGMTLSAEVLKFRTDIGVMDLIQPITDFGYGEFTVTSKADKLIYKKSEDNCFIKTIESGQEALIPGTERADYVSLSHDDKTLALVQRNDDQHDKLVIIHLP